MLQVASHVGNFFVRSSDLLALPAIDRDKVGLSLNVDYHSIARTGMFACIHNFWDDTGCFVFYVAPRSFTLVNLFTMLGLVLPLSVLSQLSFFSDFHHQSASD